VVILFVVLSVAGHFLSETGNVTFNDVHQGLSNAYYGYKDPPPPYPPSQGNFEDIFQVLQQGRKEFWETKKRLEAQLATVTELVTRLVTLPVA
ncbi:hypothetical protein PIB30_099305, partial [Stylosanthes scabra]|nr:hypothetical protein [Stylosanthes scabra]